MDEADEAPEEVMTHESKPNQTAKHDAFLLQPARLNRI